MGLIDLNAEIGRVDGGIGLALEKPGIEISAKKSDELFVKGQHRARALDAALKFMKGYGIEGGVELTIDVAFQPHIGLGLGTQLVLGVGYVLSKLYNIDVSVREIAKTLGRPPLNLTDSYSTAVTQQNKNKIFSPPPYPLQLQHRFWPDTDFLTGTLPSLSRRARRFLGKPR
jgi:hypothetical protein